jgi:hypothetical protein
MQRTIGLIFVTTGLVVVTVWLAFNGALLGMSTPIFSVTYLVTYLLIAPIVLIGPAVLLMVGSIEIFKNISHKRVVLMVGAALLIVLALWTGPRIGWALAAWLVIEPMAASLLIAALIVRTFKRSWLAVLLGSGLSAPFFVSVLAFVVSRWSTGMFVRTGDWVLFGTPVGLLIACIILALRSRNALNMTKS